MHAEFGMFSSVTVTDSWTKSYTLVDNIGLKNKNLPQKELKLLKKRKTLTTTTKKLFITKRYLNEAYYLQF